MTPVDCELNGRLAETGVDQAWDHDGTSAGIETAVLDAAKVFAKIGAPMIRRWVGDDSPLYALDPRLVKRFRKEFLFFGKTERSAIDLLNRLSSLR